MTVELHHLCSPDDPIDLAREHKHQCPSCGTTWKHSDEMMRPGYVTHAEFRAAHHCPNCGTEQRWKHYSTIDEIVMRAANIDTLSSDDIRDLYAVMTSRPKSQRERWLYLCMGNQFEH